MSSPQLWTKHYATAAACRTAAANYRWLAGLGLPVPALYAISARHLDFAYVDGRHALPADLPQLAALLGHHHHRAYRAELHRARLDRPYRTPTGLVIPSFLTGRREALRARLESGTVLHPGYTTTEAITALETAVTGPACLYKDSNPRNFLIGHGAVVTVDFDILTVAPLGYDLAKLIVTLAMTHGLHVANTIEEALASYNDVLTGGTAGLPPTPRSQLMIWTGIHHILTSPYLGRGGYQHIWHQPPTP
jgi:hypothetical protein